MTLPLILADQRLAERRAFEATRFGFLDYLDCLGFGIEILTKHRPKALHILNGLDSLFDQIDRR